MFWEALISFFLVAGASFALIGSYGFMRLPDFYSRLHGPTKATPLGVGCMLAASTLYFTLFRGDLHVHEVLVLLFLFMTAPVSAHLASKMALHLRVEDVGGQVSEQTESRADR